MLVMSTSSGSSAWAFRAREGVGTCGRGGRLPLVCAFAVGSMHSQRQTLCRAWTEVGMYPLVQVQDVHSTT